MEISVVVPIYQAEKYVNRLFESIENQSYRDFSLFLVDDGSWDDSAMLCDEYALSGNDVIICHKKNGGAGTARNNGIEYTLVSDSRWLAFLDSDDWMHKDYLKILYDGAIRNNLSVAMCSALDTKDVGYKFPDNMEANVTLKTPEELWCENRNLCVVPWGKIFRKELIKDIRFPEGVIQEDEGFSYKVLFESNRICFTNEKLYVYYQTEQSVMRTAWSPKFLAGINFLSDQVEYFHKNGYNKAGCESAKTLLYILKSYAKEIKNMKEYYKYVPELNKEFDRHFCYFKEELKQPLIGNEWVYALAYPLEMKVYYAFRKIKRFVKGK